MVSHAHAAAIRVSGTIKDFFNFQCPEVSECACELSSNNWPQHRLNSHAYLLILTILPVLQHPHDPRSKILASVTLTPMRRVTFIKTNLIHSWCSQWPACLPIEYQFRLELWRNVASVGWQVKHRDPVRHMSFGSAETIVGPRIRCAARECQALHTL